MGKVLGLLGFIGLVTFFPVQHALGETGRVSDRGVFIGAVGGKTLKRPLIALRVLPDGNIDGTAAGRNVTGNWNWKDGLFCRTLYWGATELPYNCQAVDITGDKIRFTADAGRGKSADFTLR